MAYTADDLEDFRMDLKKEIEKKYKNKDFKIGHPKVKPKNNHFGFKFGIDNVSNDYRIDSNGVKIQITVDTKKGNKELMFFDYLKSKLLLMDSCIGEKLEYRDTGRYRYIYWEYEVDDLLNDYKREKTLNELSTKAIWAMEFTLR